MSNNKQSSVELFAIALYEGGYLQGNGDDINDLLQRHKGMHEVEIRKAFKYGFNREYFTPNFQDQQEIFEKYYEQTYGGKK
jgi:hypothetical protein